MSDAEDKTAAQLAAEINSPQDAQVDVTDDTSQSPASAPATRDEPLILGKFKNQEELAASYLELERNYTASRQARVVPPQQPAETPTTVFDKETEIGISNIVEARLLRDRNEQERERAEKFAKDHAEELADPLLRATVLLEIQEANARGEIMPQEVALANAKQTLEARLNPKVEAAKKEAFTEANDVARRKEQAGAIGGVSTKTPEVDPEELSAEEYAAYYGIPHV